MNFKHKVVMRLNLDKDGYLWNKTQSYNNSLCLVIDCTVLYLFFLAGSIIVSSDCFVWKKESWCRKFVPVNKNDAIKIDDETPKIAKSVSTDLKPLNWVQWV